MQEESSIRIVLSYRHLPFHSAVVKGEERGSRVYVAAAMYAVRQSTPDCLLFLAVPMLLCPPFEQNVLPPPPDNVRNRGFG